MEPLGVRRRRGTPAGGVTPAELREAERGFKLMLARKFSAAWIAENAKDLLAQANIEYAEWLEANPPARNPVGWLLTCAYRRALNLLDTQSRKPRPASLDAVFHLADESTPTPEQQALDSDRQKRLREALSHLPEKEQKLLALIYFEDYSIRAAGRKLGWQKSAADRHHSAAMKKMLALVGDRSLLSPAILGPAAWAVARGEGHRPWSGPLEATASLAREGMAAGAEVLTVGAHRLADAWRRLAPFSEPANAAAASGAGRAAGYCAAAVGAVVCGLAATGVIGPEGSLSSLSRAGRRSIRPCPRGGIFEGSRSGSLGLPRRSTPWPPR
jgi:RNA polymerase sigma factor (sigma-70 family)